MLQEEEKEYLMKIRKLKKALEGGNANEKMDEQILGRSRRSQEINSERKAISY